MRAHRSAVSAVLLLALLLVCTFARDGAQAIDRWPPWQSYGEAEETARAKKRSGLPKLSEIAALNRKVEELRAAGKIEEAIPVAQKALRLTERRYGAAHAETATSLTTLADLLVAQNRLADAEPLLKRALAIREKAKSPDDTALALALDNLAVLYQKEGRAADAEPLRQRAIALRERQLASDPSKPAPELKSVSEAPGPAAAPAAPAAPAPEAPAEKSAAAEAPAQPMAPGAPEPAPPVDQAQEDKGGTPSAEGRARAEEAEAKRRAEAEAERARREQAAAEAAKQAEEGAKAPAQQPAAPEQARKAKPSTPEPAPQATPPPAGGGGLMARPRIVPAPSPWLGPAPDSVPIIAPTPPLPPPVMAAPPPLAAPADQQWDVVPVFYGTDRAEEPSPKRLSFNSDRGHRLQLGRALVTVPKAHQVPQIELPWAIRIPYFNLTIYEEAEDPEKHFTMQEISKLSKEEFLKLVRARLGGSQRFKEQAFVFVHGYNTSFDNAVYRTAQIAYDLKFDGVPFVYSWPSGGAVASYTYDRESAEASKDYMRTFLDMVVKETGAKQVSIIAHSMGNQPLLDVLKDMRKAAPSGVVISQVILAAPDVDADSFSNLARAINGLAQGVTLYAASNDRALQVSRKFWGHYRAGDVPAGGPLVLPGVDTIDVTALSTDAFSINHSDYAQKNELLKDISELLQSGRRPPHERTLKPERVKTQKGDYWRYAARPGQ